MTPAGGASGLGRELQREWHCFTWSASRTLVWNFQYRLGWRRFFNKNLFILNKKSFVSIISIQRLQPQILGWASFCMKYCINAMEAIRLWHCSGVIEAQVALMAAFRSSALLGLVSLIFLLTIHHRFSIGFRSGEFAHQSSTVTPWSLNQLLVSLAVCQSPLDTLAVWAGAKSCWKMKSASP